ncbi:IPT/TIG domain-containing protein [Steroidobacter flavus]|uniref:IPT/TIG domain-containing protein n=1 Tax=Steroidobacter flavus TaxID=1842136 RepID=A0ABV8SQG1_9GAMM
MRLFLGDKVHYLPGARRVAGFLLFGLLAGCGGGGGGDDSAPVQISTNAIAFSATGPSAAVPASQTFTATFGKDVVQLAVVHSGDAIAATSSVQSGRSATITVVPASPAAIGPGVFQGAVAVTGYTCADTTCSRMAAGSSATLLVNYQVSPVIQSVTPYVTPSGVSDTVIIRGLGFQAFSSPTVRFGDTAATSVTINTAGTELSATYPALAAGTYTVHLDATNHTGEVPSNVALRVVDPVAFAATTLDHPASTTAVRRLVYDAERQALLSVTDTAPVNLINRYQYANGAWGAPTESAHGFVDAALTADGTRLLAINPTSVVPMDPVTLALGTGLDAPSLVTNSALKNIVVGYDNQALITTSLTTSGSTQGYLYDPAAGTVLLNGTSLNNATPVMAGNGVGAVVVQGDPTLTSDVASYVYSSSSHAFSSTGTPTLRQNTVAPAVGRSFNRVVLNGTKVYDGNFSLLGTLPDTTTAVVLRSDGNRAYAYDSAAGGILVYDISVDRDEAAYTALGAVTPLAADPGTGLQMIITPDGGTLFIGGSLRIVVQPTPAQ